MPDRIVMIDEPSPFDTRETWERHLEQLKALPDDVALKAEMISDAEEMLARKQREG